MAAGSTLEIECLISSFNHHTRYMPRSAAARHNPDKMLASISWVVLLVCLDTHSQCKFSDRFGRGGFVATAFLKLDIKSSSKGWEREGEASSNAPGQCMAPHS